MFRVVGLELPIYQPTTEPPMRHVTTTSRAIALRSGVTEACGTR
jgi:hypothetical protein